MVTIRSNADRLNRLDARESVPATLSGDPSPQARSSGHHRVSVVEHPMVQHALTTLRNRDTPAKQFRPLSQQLLAFLAFEATRNLSSREETVLTPSGPATGQVLTKQIVLLSLTRHGMGLAHNLADFLPELLVGAVSLHHASQGGRLEPRLHLANAPALTDLKIILFDPVIATGTSAGIGLNFLRRLGANDLSLVSFLITKPGLDRVHTACPSLSVWTAAVEPELDPKRGPLPGLGNFAERLYG